MLYQLVGLFCFALVAYGRSPSKIIGGSDVEDRNFPFFVRIVDLQTGDAWCGGTIVNPRYILTAGHCLSGNKAAEIGIRVGLHSQYEKVYEVDKLIDYNNLVSDFNSEEGYHDIGLVRTTEDITYHLGYVEAVELTSKDYRTHNYPVETIGYGISSLSADRPSKLQYLATKIYGHKRCKAKNSSVKDERWLCTFEPAGEGPCLGDSGGPLLANGLQIGITSRSDACARGNYPSIWTRVYHYLDWIKEQIGNKDY